MTEDSLNELRQRFAFNLRRVKQIVEASDRIGQLDQPGPGRPSVRKTDVLRSAVVFLHASLEDLLREIAQWRLPLATPAALERIPLPNPGTSDKPFFKFSMMELAVHRGDTVDDVIRKAVAAHLDQSNYNNTHEISQLLVHIGLSPKSVIEPDGGALSALMKRRHWIVHRADRNPRSGRGQHATQSLGRQLVEQWIAAVDEFGHRLIGQLTSLREVPEDS